MTYIDSLGFHRTRLDEYLASIQAGVRGIYGANANLDPDTADGQYLGVFAEAISDLAGILEQSYNGRSPAGAIGAGLARLVRINGVTKKEPAFSEAPVTLGGVPGTFIPAGSLVGSSSDATLKFATAADYTLDGGGAATGQAKAQVAGPIVATAGALDTPLTVISGWTTVTNSADATLGTTGETDAQLRARRAASVALPSQAILDGLEAALLQLPGVEQALVRENPEDTTQTLADGGALTAHSIEVLVKGGDNLQIAQTIWLKRSLGVTMVGLHTETITDSQGVDHVINFDIPSAGIFEKPIYVEVHTAVALSGDAQTMVRQAIADRGNGLMSVNGTPLPGSKIGETVAVSDVFEAITVLKATTLPTLKVSKVFISIAPSPTTGDDLTMFYDWLPTWDAGNVTFASP